MRCTIIAFFSLLFVLSGHAQDRAEYSQNFINPTANTYGASKIMNVPLTPFTGQINLNIPLFEKKMSQLGFSISLSYTGGDGIKRFEPESNVGIGWKLNCGGVIIRHKRGVPDDYENHLAVDNVTPTDVNGIIFNNGLISKGSSSIDNSLRNTTEYQQFAGDKDGQHDIFEFSLPNLSGKFYIGKDKAILLVSEAKIKIIPIFTDSLSGGKISAFTIIDNSGIVYRFYNGPQY